MSRPLTNHPALTSFPSHCNDPTKYEPCSPRVSHVGCMSKFNSVAILVIRIILYSGGKELHEKLECVDINLDQGLQ